MSHIVLQCHTLFYNVTHCFTMSHIVLQCHTLFYNVTHCFTMSHIVLQCVCGAKSGLLRSVFPY